MKKRHTPDHDIDCLVAGLRQEIGNMLTDAADCIAESNHPHALWHTASAVRLYALMYNEDRTVAFKAFLVDRLDRAFGCHVCNEEGKVPDIVADAWNADDFTTLACVWMHVDNCCDPHSPDHDCPACNGGENLIVNGPAADA